jgi:hypothetical protein
MQEVIMNTPRKENTPNNPNRQPEKQPVSQPKREGEGAAAKPTGGNTFIS